MNKFLSLIFVLASALGTAQVVSPPAPQSRVAGRFVASNYGQWSFAPYTMPSGTGSQTFTLSNATAALPDGRIVMPFSTNAPIKVGTEVVTPTAVGSGCIVGNIGAGACAITATFVHSHSTADYISSGTFGLQEALNDAHLSGGGAVTIDSAWVSLGGTTAIYDAAVVPSSTNIEDVRAGIPTPPTGGITQLTGDVNAGPGSGSQAASVVKVNGQLIPLLKTVVGTDSAGHIIDADSATLSNNTNGTAAGLSGTPALPNGTTATTQSVSDNSTDVATDAFVQSGIKGVPFCTGYTPTNGQVITLTTGSSPNPCYTAATPSGGSGGAWMNITGKVTVSGCTVSNGACAVSGGSTSAVTFSDIPSTYNRLQLVIWGQDSTSSTDHNQITFNSDTGSNYAYNATYSTATNSSAGTLPVSTASSCYGGVMNNGVVSESIIDIPFYANTSFKKAAHVASDSIATIAAGLANNYEFDVSCGWNNTAAITSITSTISANDYASGTSFELLAE